MSVIAAFQPTAAPRRPLRTVLADVVHRLAASPLDSPALLATQPVSPKMPLQARWRAVTTPDGTTRLEAGWHRAH